MGNVQGRLAGPDLSEESDVEEVSGPSNPPTCSDNHEESEKVAEKAEKVGGQEGTPNEDKGGHWAWRCLAGVGRMFLGTGDGGARVKPVKRESGNSFGAVNREERRKKLAEAASKRVQNQTKPIKTSSSVQFQQQRKKEIEKREKQAARMGCGDDVGVKPLEHENGNSSGAAKIEVEGQNGSTPPQKMEITNASGGNSDDEKMTESDAQVEIVSSVSPPSQEDRRRKLAEAAAKRLQNQASRGIKNSSSVQFRQQRKEEIEKREEQAARMGGGNDGKPTLRWQM